MNDRKFDGYDSDTAGKLPDESAFRLGERVSFPAETGKLPEKLPNLPEAKGMQDQQGNRNGYREEAYYQEDGYWNENPGYEYPTIECKAASINFWNVVFPSVFAFAFGFTGVAVPLGASTADSDFPIALFCIPFGLVGLGAAAIVVVKLWRFFKTKFNGKRITGLVCGYMDDSVMINRSPAQIVKILLDTPVGKRYILYKLGTPMRPYEIYSQVDLMVSGNNFLICKNEEKIDW